MKKCWIQFGVTLAVLLVCVCGFIFLIDPLYYYHAPTAGTSVYLHNQVYQTEGAARYFTYDSAIVGTSMTENFRASWLDEMGLHASKLSYAGARTVDLRTVLDAVYESKNDVKFIIMDVNDYQLTGDPDATFVGESDGSYGDGVLSGAEYFLNNDVFWMSVGRTAEAVTGRQPDPDEAFTWEDPELFSEEAVKNDCRELISSFQWKKQQGLLTPMNLEEMLQTCDENMDNVLPVIEAHPETQFAVFYPPYSILYWQEQIVQDGLEEMLEVYRHSIERLLEYENVQVYYFQDEEEIITTLNNYRDVCHHNPQINRYMFECIRDGKNLITEENLDSRIQNMNRIASEYPYDSIWDE
ncbi:MAG: hypothetical protein IKC46_02615 [Lachnospiraceae bacterium]|nr:hypothetical protein [Lachnospiraceae bacterium]